MDKTQEMVREFHYKHGHRVGACPGIPSLEEMHLRDRLMEEELNEFGGAMNNADLVACADALGDLIYVAYGAALSLGLDMKPIIAEIHRSNMTKPLGRQVGKKVRKGTGYEPPNLEEIIQEQARRCGCGV